jgi:DNA ligase (NAD+)
LHEKRYQDLPDFHFPTHCPSCHTPIVQTKDRVAKKCPAGFLCPAQAMERLKHFVSRDAFNIEGLGGRNIEFLYQQGLIQTPCDIFNLEERNTSLSKPLQTLEGWGETSTANLFSAIQQRRTIALERFIYALGIPQVGIVTAKLIAKFSGKLEVFLKIQFDDLMTLDGIGPTVAEEVTNFLKGQEHLYMIEMLESFVNVLPYEEKESVEHSMLKGKTLVFTGTLELMTRTEAKKLAEKNGATVSGSLSSRTHFLIVGKNAGSKLVQAQELSVQTLTEEEWLSIVTP